MPFARFGSQEKKRDRCFAAPVFRERDDDPAKSSYVLYL